MYSIKKFTISILFAALAFGSAPAVEAATSSSQEIMRSMREKQQQRQDSLEYQKERSANRQSIREATRKAAFDRQRMATKGMYNEQNMYDPKQNRSSASGNGMSRRLNHW